MPLLSVSGLRTAFASEAGPAFAVRGVSLELESGETVGLVGESGCGKSVTALSIMGLLPPSARIVDGTIVLEGAGDLAQASRRTLRSVRGKRIAMIFQDSMTSLNPLLTVGAQIRESLELHLGLRGAELKRRAVSLLEEVGIPEPERRLKQYPHQLSGGLRQRVAVAVALAPNPQLLIADEPTTALDVTIQAQLLELLRREQRQRGMAVILITHDLGVVAGMADRVCVMYAGRIVETGPVDEVYAHPQHPYTLGLLRSVPRISGAIERRLRSIAGNPPAIWAVPPGCPFVDRCEFAFARCSAETPELRGEDGHAAACFLRETA